MAVLLAKRALPRTLDAPPPEVAEQLAQLPLGFGQQALDGPALSLNLKKLSKPPGAWRLRTGDWRSIFFQTGDDFLVAAIGLRKDIYERANRMRLARRGDGLTVIEATARQAPVGGVRSGAVATQRSRQRPRVEQNPLSPFDDAMLQRIAGVDDGALKYVRSLPATVDAPAALAEHLEDVDLAFLLADMWERPQHHLATFAAGDVPSIAGLEIEEAELQARLTATSSATEVVEVTTSAQIRKLLDGSIEEWMVYLHPSQRAIANATFNGPARVRGGPGTGKTVVALHRARVLGRQRVHAPDKVLLTTFLSTLPKVWVSLMGLLDARALERLDVRNIDVLARELVAEANGGEVNIASPSDRQKIVEPLLKRHGLEGAMAANSQLLLDEFDAFLAGRGIDELDDYLAVRRRGGGSGLARADRERVFAAFEEYRLALRKRRMYDWAHVRLEALRLATEGAGPRYDGVIIDEAQDLSAVGMRLLLTLDRSEQHRHFLIVGDGQQSIYPGGFGLREIGVDIVGRSRVLTANWRNTWSVWTAAKAVMAGHEFDDLDEDVGLRPTGDEPEPLTVGEPAELHVLRSPAEELEMLVALVQERLDAGIDKGDIAVLVEVKRKGDEVVKALEAAGVGTNRLDRYEGEHADGVLVGTFNRAKGLEFKEVLIPGLAAAEWPSRWFVPPDLVGDQRDERMALQLRTLFVGMSRARDRLVLLAGGPPCAPVAQATWALDVREY
ncbi:MAG: UvrD-helicase domain-containing protein [Solirubrobacteraceae bacterium]